MLNLFEQLAIINKATGDASFRSEPFQDRYSQMGFSCSRTSDKQKPCLLDGIVLHELFSHALGRLKDMLVAFSAEAGEFAIHIMGWDVCGRQQAPAAFAYAAFAAKHNTLFAVVKSPPSRSTTDGTYPGCCNAHRTGPAFMGLVESTADTELVQGRGKSSSSCWPLQPSAHLESRTRVTSLAGDWDCPAWCPSRHGFS